MPTIESLEACTVSVPLSNPITFATRTVRSREFTLVRVRDSDGVTGLGFCYVSNEGGQLATHAVRSLFAPKLIGQDAAAIQAHWERLYQDTLLHGRAGSVMRGLSAVDIALWDRSARSVGLPLWKYLGGAEAATVGAYASGGYYMEGKGLDGLADEIDSYVGQGFTAAKIKVGAVSVSEDAERAAVARERLGPDGILLLDANHAWTTYYEAMRAVEQFAESDPLFIEEPFGPDDTLLHRRLARTSPVPIATGELLSGRWAFQRLLEDESVEFAQPDATGCGGISEFLRIASTCASFGVEVWPHWLHDLHVHLVAALPNAGLVEFFPDSHVLNFRELLSDQLVVEEGRLVLPQRPGLGVDLDEDQIAHYQIDAWS